jgi:hypothetical protein
VSVFFLPDDKYVVSGSSDGAVKIWETATGRCCRTIVFPEEELAACAVTSDGKRLICGGDRGSLRLWSLDTGWFSVNFLEPALCRPRTFKELEDLHRSFKQAVEDFRRAWQESDRFGAVAIFERMTKIRGFSWSRETILIRNLLQEAASSSLFKSATFVRSFQGHSDAVVCLATSADSLLLVSGSLDGTAAIWDVVTGACITKVNVGSAVKAVFSLPRAHGIFTLGVDGILRNWDMHGNMLNQVAGIRPPLSVDEDNLTLTATSHDNRMVRIELESGQEQFEGAAIPSGDWICFSKDRRHVYSLRDDTRILRWAMATGRNEGAFRDLGTRVISLEPTMSDDRVVAGLETGEVAVYMVGSSVNVSTLRGHAAAVRALAAGPDESLWVTGSDDCSLRVWDLAREKCLAVLEGHSSPVRAAKFFPNGSMIASGGSDGSVRLWGLEWEIMGWKE